MAALFLATNNHNNKRQHNNCSGDNQSKR
jgi:hypothetical protein